MMQLAGGPQSQLSRTVTSLNVKLPRIPDEFEIRANAVVSEISPSMQSYGSGRKSAGHPGDCLQPQPRSLSGAIFSNAYIDFYFRLAVTL